jgi:hypothetical protein
VSSPPQPSGDTGLVLAISLAELRLDPALFPRHDQDYDYRQDHEPEQNDEAAEGIAREIAVESRCGAVV